MLVDEALAILAALGVPFAGLSDRRKTRMAKAVLAVAGMKPGMEWPEARADNRLRSRDVIRWMNDFLDENVSSGSYDDIRRKDLLLPVEAGIVLKSAGKAGAATNDGTRSFALSPEVTELLQRFGTSEWNKYLESHLKSRESLAEQLRKVREHLRVPIQVDREVVTFGPGEHNELQKVIVEEFLPRFGHGAEVFYIGDTENKLLILKSDRLLELGFFELSHDKLPDVVAYSKSKNWLFLIEAVHSANPIDELRKRTLEQLTVKCTSSLIFVTCFLTRPDFRRFAKDIAWETEVWIAEFPDHLIHFNGDKFMGPHVSVNAGPT